MISKAKISFIQSLSLKKFRDEHNCFVAEGIRIIRDLHPAFACKIIVATENWALENNVPEANEQFIVDEKTFKKLSGQKKPQGILAIYHKKNCAFDPSASTNDLVLALDGIQDPGNLGTILRIADWFGIHQVICSPSTADLYNPKTIQATMGALVRVNVHYLSLPDLLSSLPDVPVVGTFLNGTSIYESELPTRGVIVMGNEGNGISAEVEKLVTSKLLIPSFPIGQSSSESLNVGVAAAIICSEFRRRQ
jgi:TrmH family RNA methyltransferase